MFGLVKRGNEPLVRYVLKMFKKKGKSKADFDLATKFKATFSREPKMYFIGVWDTVSSVGWLYDPLILPFSAKNPDIQVGRHAVSLDERRAAFRQNLWIPLPGQNIEQVWFAGVHSDIGGGYSETESGLAKITLQWLIAEAESHGLLTSASRRDAVLGITDPSMSKPDPLAKMHKSLKGMWWILEYLPRRHWDMQLTPPAERWKIPNASPRYVAAGSVISPSVDERKKNDLTYRPVNLP
jgi:uncharacterized protein (DUF2235 family)